MNEINRPSRNPMVARSVKQTNWFVCILNTRDRILYKNMESMHRHGYQGTRVDRIIEDLGITKGAFYHHFSSKQQLGYAVIDEILAPEFISRYAVLENHPQPLQGLVSLLDELKSCSTAQDIAIGCPLNNLIQEMAPLDDGFRSRLAGIVDELKGIVSAALQRAADQGQMRAGLDPSALSTFVVSSIEGAYGIAKVYNHQQKFEESIQVLQDTIQGWMIS